MTETAATIWRPYELPGVPASGPHNPVKRDIAAWGTMLETLLQGGGAGLAYASKAALAADLAHPAHTTAIVYADATAANNGIYVKNGDSGAGSWTWIGDLAGGIVRFTVTGGTANAIAVSSPAPSSLPGNKLYLLTPAANNTDPTTIAVNGGAAVAVKSALGSALVANSLLQDSTVLMAWVIDHYQLLISVPVDATGILNDAIAARNAAENFSLAASASASALGNQVHQYDTRAQAAAATIPVGVQAIKVTRYAAGFPLCYATYIPGTAAGPMAFQEAGGNWWELDLSGGIVRAPWFGAKGDGINDDTAELQAALTASEGKFLTLRGLSYLITTTLTGVDDIEVWHGTLVPSTAAAHPVISFTNKTNWQLRKIWFKSDYPTDLDYGTSKIGAVYFTNSTANALENMAIEDCTFSDFADNYWIYGSISSTGVIKDFRFCRNRVLSTGIGGGANYQAQFHAFLNLFGSGVSDLGIFVDAIVEDNHGDFDDINIGLALWSRNKGFRINRNVIRNPGANSTFSAPGTDLNCYGIIVYDVVGASGSSTTCGIDGEVAHNYILNPPSAGIYGAGAEDVNFHDNIVVGQFRTDDTTLPRAGISLNDGRKCKVHHNRLLNCWGGVAVVSVYGSETTEVADNYIKSSTAADAFGFRIGSTAGTLTASTIAIRRNKVEVTGASARGLRQISDAGSYFGTVIIEGNEWTAAYRAIEMSSAYLTGRLIFRGNKYLGVCASGALYASTITVPLIVQGEEWIMDAMTGLGANFDASTALCFIDSVFVNKISGSACVQAIGAQGSIDGIKFRNVDGTKRLVASSLGYTVPAFSGVTGDVVQNLSSEAYTEAGAAASKYLVQSWICATGTTWRQQRVLTGN